MAKTPSPANFPSVVDLAAIKIIKGFNPRKNLGDLEGLRTSIKENGIVQAVTVRPTAKDGVFELISGHRRHAIAKELGLKTVPVTVRPDLSDDSAAFAAAMAENSEGSRSNLDAVDEAAGFKKLQDGGMTPKKIAKSVGCSDQHIRNSLRLLDLDSNTQKKLIKGEISKMVALALSGLDAEMAKKVIPLVTSETSEREVKEMANAIAREAAANGETAPVTKGSKGGGKKGVPESNGDLLKVWQTKKAINDKILDLVEAIEGADAEEAEPLKMALAALLWSRGDLEEIATKGKAFKVAYKAVVDSIEWADEDGDESEGGEEEGEDGASDDGDDEEVADEE